MTAGQDHFMSAAKSVADQIALPDPAFDFEIWWPSSYESLFRGDHEETTDVEAIAERALHHGRLVIHAAGGTGKTSILARLFKRAVEQNRLPVKIDLRLWHPELFDAWAAWRDNEPARMRILLEELAVPRGLTEAAMDELQVDVPRLVMVDGLNEVPTTVGDALIRTLDAFARRHPLAGVIVTDRLVRRPLDNSRWALATIGPLDGEAGLMGTAFFRDLAIREGIDSASSAGVHHTYIVRHAGLTDPQILIAGQAALDLYATTASRTFLASELAERAGPDLSARLHDSGVVVTYDSLCAFRHHLIHDFLASFALASKPELWERTTFDAITLGASSFDALSMALEQIQQPSQADLLLRRIYDWNLYAAAYALGAGRTKGSTTVSIEMEAALLAMLAERRWDIIRATAQQSSDALAVIPSAVASRLLDAADIAEIVSIAAEFVGDRADLQPWLTIFGGITDEAIEDEHLLLIIEPDSLVGWTMANVLKRSRLTRSQESMLHEILADSTDATVRWRVVHALGAQPSRATASHLFQALADADQWVRYGAIRSLVEIAARSDELRRDVFDELRSQLGSLAEDQRVIGQLERSVVLQRAPKGWADVVGPLVEDLWAAAETQERQDHWRKVAYELRRSQDESDSRVA